MAIYHTKEFSAKNLCAVGQEVPWSPVSVEKRTAYDYGSPKLYSAASGFVEGIWQ